jgi:hypothetical protein
MYLHSKNEQLLSYGLFSIPIGDWPLFFLKTFLWQKGTHVDEAKRLACGKIAIETASIQGGKSETEKTNI